MLQGRWAARRRPSRASWNAREGRKGGRGVGVLLAAAMGHESETTTIEHCAGRNAVAQSLIERVTGSMN